MPPKRDPRRDKAAEIYREHNGQIDLVEIARQLDVPEGTVRGWKSKDNWNAPNVPLRSNQSERSETTSKAQPPPPAGTPEMVEAVLENTELNPQQQLFCLYYANGINATQSYLRAYNCSYQTALTNGPALLGNTRINAEVARLRKIKLNAHMYTVEDFVDHHIRVLNGNITDVATFGTIPKPGHEREAQDGTITPQNMQNILLFKSSDKVDGSLIQKISVSDKGASIQLVDKKASARFMERYLQTDPMDDHRRKVDARKLETELMKIEASQPPQMNEDNGSTSNLLDAMTDVASDTWGDEKPDDNPGDE